MKAFVFHQLGSQDDTSKFFLMKGDIMNSTLSGTSQMTSLMSLGMSTEQRQRMHNVFHFVDEFNPTRGFHKTDIRGCLLWMI